MGLSSFRKIDALWGRGITPLLPSMVSSFFTHILLHSASVFPFSPSSFPLRRTSYTRRRSVIRVWRSLNKGSKQHENLIFREGSFLTELGKAASSVNEAVVIMMRNVNSGVRVVFHLSTTQWCDDCWEFFSLL